VVQALSNFELLYPKSVVGRNWKHAMLLRHNVHGALKLALQFTFSWSRV